MTKPHGIPKGRPGQAGPEERDPVTVVLTQDEAFRGGNIDTELWITTLFFPLIMLVDGHPVSIQDPETATSHLRKLGQAARELGVAALRTRILSHVQPAPDLSILCSIRDRLDQDGTVLASTSMTWTLMQVGTDWKITQILFDENRFDRSVTNLMRRRNDMT